jgi:hypothetical protein
VEPGGAVADGVGTVLCLVELERGLPGRADVLTAGLADGVGLPGAGVPDSFPNSDTATTAARASSSTPATTATATR